MRASIDPAHDGGEDHDASGLEGPNEVRRVRALRADTRRSVGDGLLGLSRRADDRNRDQSEHRTESNRSVVPHDSPPVGLKVRGCREGLHESPHSETRGVNGPWRAKPRPRP